MVQTGAGVHSGRFADPFERPSTPKMRFTAAATQELPWYVARRLEVEVTSQGESVEDALTNLREALDLYFEDQPLPDRIDIPIIAPVDIPP